MRIILNTLGWFEISELLSWFSSSHIYYCPVHRVVFNNISIYTHYIYMYICVHMHHMQYHIHINIMLNTTRWTGRAVGRSTALWFPRLTGKTTYNCTYSIICFITYLIYSVHYIHIIKMSIPSLSKFFDVQ